LAFGASSAAGISTNAIQVTLSGTNLTLHFTTNLFCTNGLVVTGTLTARNVSYPGLVTNAVYTAVISATDGNGNLVSVTRTFDTYNPSFIWEAEDYDYNNGLFIDNPQTNAYAGLAGVS